MANFFSIITLVASLSISASLLMVNMILYFLRRKERDLFWLCLLLLANALFSFFRLLQFFPHQDFVHILLARLALSLSFLYLYIEWQLLSIKLERKMMRFESGLFHIFMIVLIFLTLFTPLIMKNEILRRVSSGGETYNGAANGVLFGITAFFSIIGLIYLVYLQLRSENKEFFFMFPMLLALLIQLFAFLNDFLLIFFNYSWIRMTDIVFVFVGSLLTFSKIRENTVHFSHLEVISAKKLGELKEDRDRWQAEKEASDAEKAKLKEQKDLLKEIVDSSRTLMGALSSDGRLIMVNRTALEMLNSGLDEVQNRYFWESPWWGYSKREQVRLKNEFSQLIKKKEKINFRTRQLGAGGELRDIDFSLNPVTDDEGNILRHTIEGIDLLSVSGIQENIIKNQIEQTSFQLEKGVLAAMNRFFGLIVLLADKKITEDELFSPGDAVNQIKTTALTASANLEAVLEVNLNCHEKEEIVELNALVGGILPLLNTIAGEFLKVTLEQSDETLYVRGCPRKIHQALVNLIFNSVEASGEGESVTISVRKEHLNELEAITPGNARDDLWTAIVVKDNGCGFQSPVLTDLVKAGYSTKANHAGMGLTITDMIMRDMKGEFIPRVRTSGGAEIKLVFPRVYPGENELNKNIINISADQNHLLLVEDDRNLRNLIADMLIGEGFRVFEADGYRSAIEIVEKSNVPISLMISDIVLPGGESGVDLYKKIAERDNSIKVLFISGYSQEMLSEYNFTGGRNFLKKPFDREQILSLIDHLLTEGETKNE